MSLSLNEIRKNVPSAFAARAHSKMSDRYAFISSASILETLTKDHGFEVFEAKQRNTRTGGRNPLYTRHMITLRPNGASKNLVAGECIPQLVLTNSHDGQSKIRMNGGLFRVICSNGLMTSIQAEVCAMVHRGDPAAIIAEALKVIEAAGKSAKAIEAMKKTKLTQKEQASFAIKAAKIAYDEPLSFDPQLLLAARRKEDEAANVWTVFNRLQENIMRGGVEFESRASGRSFSTRGLTHIGRTIDVNTQLWEVATKLSA